MTATQQDVIRRYLGDAIAAEQGIASQMHDLASEGDDEEVHALLSDAASQAQSRADFLTSQLNGDAPGSLKTAAANLFASFSRAAQIGHIEEERIVQNLISGYSMEMSACGMYQALNAAATSAGDTATAQFATDAITANKTLAARLFHFIPTRAIIAYNMLTISEVDPAVETKYGEGSWAG